MSDKLEGLAKTHPEIHRDIDRYSRAANIMPKFIINSMTPYTSEQEQDLYTNFQKRMKTKSGIVYVGFEEDDIHTKFSAIAGFFIRNYVNARVIMSNQMSMKGEDTRSLDCSVMLVPDLFINYRDADNIPSWRLSDITSVLYHRASHNKPTIVYIQNWKQFSNIYGKLLKDLIETYTEVRK